MTYSPSLVSGMTDPATIRIPMNKDPVRKIDCPGTARYVKAPTPIARHFCPNEPHCELTGHDVRICSRKESEGRTYDLLHKSASACFRKQPPACPRASPTATPAQLAASMYHLSDKPRPISSPSRRPSIAMLSTSRVELGVIPTSVNLMKPSLALAIHRDAIRCVAESRRAFDARIFG